MNKLASDYKNVCVVGDDSQSIYSFRGAKIENILNFRNDYPGYKLYKLEQNYRSTKNIVNAANSIIAKNKNQIYKKVWSKNETGNKIKVIKALTDNEEGCIISNLIIEAKNNEQLNYEDFAILYRTNAQSRIFEEALRKINIPYKIYGSISFYQKKEIKDLLAYFKLTINKKDEEALKRVINYPARGIGKTTLGKLRDFSVLSDISIWEIISNFDQYEIDLKQRVKNKISAFVKLINEFSSQLKTMNAYDLALIIISSTVILKEFQNPNSQEEISKKENIQELLNGIKEFTLNQSQNGEIKTLDRYLENISLLTDVDIEKPEDKNKVTIMTMHSAKGLEFNNVYIVGVEEDLFPFKLSASSLTGLEEERRLFYVALTRAKKNVTVSYTQSRYKWGILSYCKPSRFIKEIDKKYLYLSENNLEDSSFLPGDFKLSRQTMIAETSYNNAKTANPDNPDKIQVGMQVEHKRFGSGKILNLEGTSPNIKATVFFKNSGQKLLLLKFAKLKIIK